MTTIKMKNSDLLLEQIEDLSNLAKFSAKTKGNTTRDYVDSLLDVLDELIRLSADRFMSLGDIDHDEIKEEDYKQYIVHPDDIITAKKYSSFILLKLISAEMLFEDDKDDERMGRAARLMAHMSGRGAAGPITRTWHIPFLNSDGVRQELLVPLHEPCYIGNDLGFKTWGAAPMMAKKLLQQNVIPDISDCRVLELGTGTGMVGLICDHLGASEVHVTDYHPRVLENVAYNIELNQSRAKVSKLDFIKVAKGECAEWHNQKFDIVIASDLLYEMEHAEYLPIAVEKLMKNDFYFMVPLRDTHWQEVNHFEAKMNSLGLFIRKTQDSEREEEEGLVRFRYYEFSREPLSNLGNMNYDTTPTPSYKQMTNNNNSSSNQKDMYYQATANSSPTANVDYNAKPNMSPPSIDHVDEELQQRHMQQLFEKKRRRRESHNAVERRRRDNINERIFELSTLLPERDASKNNKGTILRKSVDHIRLLHGKVNQYQQRVQELENMLEMYRMRWGDLPSSTNNGTTNGNTTTTNTANLIPAYYQQPHRDA
ncbi:hypothetical protein [Parasitella parasitica]|uniref:BHLH domain-containing protein n=1 Tax=Parasitella parasitica TaxID=35722 RepID=A0A0B7NC90_9FUNG|nr:hypothetical protein [Parasitella parasitica]